MKPQADTGARDSGSPFRIAAIATTWHHRRNSPLPSHAEVILGRWLAPGERDAEWGWPGPRSTLASLHIEQLQPADEIHTIAKAHGLPLAKSIDEALTLGSGALAVDGVMIIAEHGDYPRNEVGQMLYPRKQMFDAIVSTFERCGRCVPVFCDKHFSWRFDWAMAMLDTAKRMGFTLFGGSSIPHCAFAPPLPDPQTHPPTELVYTYGGHVEDAGFHSMEWAQSYVELRPGGETGVASVTSYRGETLSAARSQHVWSPTLEEAARRVVESPGPGAMPDTAFVVEHADGLRVTHLHFAGLEGWGVATHSSDGTPCAARAATGSFESGQGHFARLARLIEDGLITGRPPFPVERTLLATGTLAAAMPALERPGQPQPTPQLAIAYRGAAPAVTRGDTV